MNQDDPGHPSNNPYAEGGTSPSPGNNAGRSNAIYFCHQCQADIRENDVLRTPELTCPQCRGTFLEKIDESQDDPHAFDTVPDNPFAFFGGGGGPHQHFPQGHGMHGGQGGPFAALLGQLFGAMGQPPQQGQQSPSSQSQQPQSQAEQGAPGAASSASSSRPGTSASIVRTPGGAAVIIRSSSIGSRPPSRQEGPPSTAHPDPPEVEAQRDPPRQQSPEANNGVPIRNLASFLTEAFGGRSEEPRAPEQQQQQQQASPLQEGVAQRAHDDERPTVETDDIFTSMLRALAGQAGVPIGHAHQQQQQQQQPSGTANPSSPTPPTGEGQQQGQAAGGGAHRPGVARVMFGNGNGGMTFSFVTGPGAGPGGEAAGQGGMMPFPFPFLMGGAQGLEGGRMGDYVFSQGALDNIITELMNQASGRYGPQPAPQEMIDELPAFKMTKDLLASDTISDCAVCKDDFQEDDGVMKLPCNHLFHNDCIKPWLERSGTCPVCRHQLVAQPEPPRNPNIPATPGAGAGAGQDAHMHTGESAPVSPSVARSPPIEGGSRMPGGFPGLSGGFPFNLFGFGGPSSSSSTSQSNAESSGASRSAGNSTGRSQQEDNNPQGQPDLDLDLD